MLNRYLSVAGFLLFVLVNVSAISAQDKESEVIWQQSEGVAVQLGIRDKYGKLGNYKATFLVQGPKEQYEIKKSGSEDKWTFVYFPNDFTLQAGPGIYTWKGLINGKAVADGSFEFKTEKTYCDSAKVLRK